MVCSSGFAAVQKMISSLVFNNVQELLTLHTDKIGIVLAKGTQPILLDIGEQDQNRVTIN